MNAWEAQLLKVRWMLLLDSWHRWLAGYGEGGKEARWGMGGNCGVGGIKKHGMIQSEGKSTQGEGIPTLFSILLTPSNAAADLLFWICFQQRLAVQVLIVRILHLLGAGVGNKNNPKVNAAPIKCWTTCWDPMQARIFQDGLQCNSKKSMIADYPFVIDM